MLFTAIYTERPGPEMIADILVIFARRDEQSAADVTGTRQNLESEGLIVYTKDATTLAEFSETIPTPTPSPGGEGRGEGESIVNIFEGPAGDYLRQTNGMNRAQLEALPASPSPGGEGRGEGGHTKREATEATKVLRGFIGHSQMACLADSCRGEEKQFFFDKLCEYAARIAAMPQTYDQDGKGDEAIVHLHYFTGGCDWFITEKDKGTEEERADGAVEQQQAFGYANLGDPNCAELGYISIVEIIANGAELDLYFTPKPLKDCKHENHCPA
jgi:hypothetical protein